MKTEYPTVLTFPCAHKLKNCDLPLKAHELEMLFLMACDHSNAQIADRTDYEVETVNGHISAFRQKSGYCYHGIISFAFKYRIVRFENNVLVRGWEVLDAKTYRIKP